MARTCWQRHRLTPLVGAAVVSLLVMTTAGPVAAAPAAPAAPANPADAVPDRVTDRLAGQRTYDVTLVTGDTVHVSVASDGRYTTRVDLAQRPDGRQVHTQTLVDGEHVYVLPSDAAALVAAGRVDRRLFDVRHLIDDGYADAASPALPVIVQYGGPATAREDPRASARLRDRADALPAGTPVRTLESINAVAMSVTRRESASLWSALDPGPAAATTLSGGVSRVWLDGRVRASLDRSVPMIGAPEAWAAGYDGTGVRVAVLDTGIDETHPDLAGKVVASRSFVPGVTSVRDGNGHGTHVASTIAGTGAASGDKYRGVAPGAGLVIGKVLADNGTGGESEIIDGMEWAVTGGARIISMSLGSRAPSDGTDPMSQAVNDLTASSGALFVIAAGNEGPGARTVAAPGAADAALTVAAVDKADQLANFSNRGPRSGDFALKPEIAAPGVDIVAARAAGTALGPVVEEHYTRISGTSMATPHVAGAAAILLQQHPDWTGEQVKAALTSTSKDLGYTGYEQGAGRVQVGAASAATVVAGTVKVDFGRLRFPQTGPPVSKTVTYRNTGSSAVTLTLAASLRTDSGDSAPDGMLTVTPSTLDVPAGATAEATVVLDPVPGPVGAYSGAVTATSGGGVALRVPVGAYKDAEGFDLTVGTVTPDQAVDALTGALIVRRVDKDTGEWIVVPAGSSTRVRLDEGVYMVTQSLLWKQTRGDFDNLTFMVNPEVRLDRDTSIVLDANTAKLATPDVERPSEALATTMAAWRIPAGSDVPYGVVTNQMPYRIRAWVTPTEKATTGTFLFEHQYLLGSPVIAASVARWGRHPELRLHPRYQHYSAFVPKLDGRMSLPVVDVATGSAEDFARVDVRGKVALVDIGEKSLAPLLGTNFAREELDRAARAGAKAVFAYGASGWPVLGTIPMTRSAYPLPTVALVAEEGAALAARLAQGPATLRIDSQPDIDDLYSLSYMEEAAVPSSVHREVRDQDLATVRPNVHADRPVSVNQLWTVRRPKLFQPDEFAASFMANMLNDIPGPLSRTERVGPLSASTLWGRSLNTFDLARMLELNIGHPIAAYLGSMFTYEVFDRPVARHETWGQAPTVPGVPAVPQQVGELLGANGAQCAVCRYSGLLPDGDMMPILTMGTDGAGRFSQLTTFANGSLHPERSGVDEWHLYRDGVELPQQSLNGVPGLFPFYVVPPGPATYRLTEHFVDWEILGGFGNRADTTWTFASADPAGRQLPPGYDGLGLCADACRAEPLLYLRYQFDLRSDNRLPAPGVHTFVVSAYRQPSLAAMPPVAGLRMSASVDGGRHWTRVPAIPLGGGRYAVIMLHPRLHGDSGTVSLRTEAWDTAGNRVEQTLPDAYGLLARH